MSNEVYAFIARLTEHAICALDDTRAAVFGNLHDAELRAMNFKGAGEAGLREQAPYGLLMLESARALACALQAGIEPYAVLVDTQTLLSDDAEKLCQAAYMVQVLDDMLARFPQTPVLEATTQQFCEITGYPKSRGMLVACKRPCPRSAVDLLAEFSHDVQRRRVCVVENVTNYANIAAIFSAAAAFGVDAVLVTPSCYDPWYRRAVRASHGAVFSVPWAYFDAAEGEHWSRAGIAQLHDAGFAVAAFALKDEALPVQDARLKTHNKLACVVGTEGAGLDEQTIAASDYTVIIPMAAQVDSLNVAAASAVAFWELGRAR